MREETNAPNVTNEGNVSAENNVIPVIRNYKDSVFRMIFSNKRALLNLYNALNGTDYQNPDELEVNTLENAIYLGRKNDISFVIYGKLNLYEHQSTINPNMPLRSLLYITSIYSKLAVNLNTYSSNLEKIPSPHFVTFYNGTEEQPERQILKLSDAYEVQGAGMPEDTPELELRVQVININSGYNKKLLEKCRELQEYMIYVDRVRKYALSMELSAAVEKAVDECIREGILADFLRKNRAEVVSMSIFEYNQEEHFKLIERESRERGFELGRAAGMEAGKAVGIELGKAEGRATGRAEGRAVGKAESVLEVLSELGSVPEGLSKRIMSEKNLDILKNWLKLAAKCDSIEAFEKQIQ